MGKEILTNIVFPFAKDILPGLLNNFASNATSNVIDKLGRKINRKIAVRAGKEFTLFISKENMDDIIKIVDSLKKSGLLINGASETIKHEIIKKNKVDFVLL